MTRSIQYAGAPGSVGILSVGAGDIKISFDKSNPAERIRAARVVAGMIRQGYALLVEAGTDGDGKKIYRRALGFDEDACEYIIADFDPLIGADIKEDTNAEDGQAQARVEEGTAAPAAAPGKRVGKRRVAAEKTSAVAVGRTAGG